MFILFRIFLILFITLFPFGFSSGNSFALTSTSISTPSSPSGSTTTVQLVPVLKTLDQDNFKWKFKTKESVIAIRDIHGDFDALFQILLDQKLINQDGLWIGGKSHLVLVGDLNDRGSDTRSVLDFLIKLEVSADLLGGKVHVLNGNHEVMVTQGDLRYVSVDEMMNFYGFRGIPNIFKGVYDAIKDFQAAFLSPSKYASWIASHNSLIQINDTLFVHGGVNEWILSHSPGRINSTIRAWLKHFQNKVAFLAPETETDWVLGSSHTKGPLWSRNLTSLASAPVENQVLDAILAKYQLSRVIIAHTVHPQPSWYYEGRVLAIDTGISRVYGGNLYSIKIDGSKVVPLQSLRPKAAFPIKKIIQNQW